jgi:hypothetical protein
VALVSVAFALALAPAANAGNAVYRDPLSYDGINKAPKTEPPPLPPQAVLSDTGQNPDVLVDEAGTAHIVWNEGRGDDADAEVYCRLPRGATACESTATLTWDKTYEAGDGPQFNTDQDGPRIVRVGDQLVVLSYRYPTNADKPGGASSETEVAWSSSDGGITWSKAVIVGQLSLGQVAVLGAEGQTPSIVNLASDPFCGMCISAVRSGQYSGAQAVLNTNPNSNYNPTLVRDGDGLVAGFSDLDQNIWLRRYNGGTVTDAASWPVSGPVPGDEPDLASGPGGLYMLSRPGYFGPFQVTPLTSQPDKSVSVGDPVQISPDDGNNYGRLAEDPSGRLLAAWSQADTGVVLRTSTSGPGGFAEAQTLADGNDNGQIELDATSDGGGFAVFNHTGQLTDPGQIVAVGFGRSAPTQVAGLGGIEGGGGDVEGNSVGFGAFRIESPNGFLLHGTGARKNLVVSDSELDLNGLRIIPDAGAQIVLDPKKLRIDTVGEVRVLLSGPGAEVVLFHGEIHRDLANLKPGSDLFEFPVGEFAANVLGFDVPSDIPVELTADGLRIPVDIELPPEFGGFTGHAELLADSVKGLHLDSLQIHAGPIPLGVLVVNNVDVDWKSSADWTGSAKLTFPVGGAIDALIQFTGGDFAGASFDYTLNPAAVIGPFVYLISVGGGFFLDPVKIIARAAIGLGAAIEGESPVKVNGEFTMTFPDTGPASFVLKGVVDVLTVEIGDAFLEFETDGYAQFGGESHLELGPLTGGMKVEGFVDGTDGQFGADMNGDAQFCLEFPNPFGDDIPICGGVGTSAAVSSIGFAACASLDPPLLDDDITAGLELRWDDVDPGALFNPILATAQLIEAISIPCDTGPYTIPPPRPAPRSLKQAGGQAFAIDGGLPSATVLVTADGGVPDVTVTGPNGETVVTGSPTDSGYVLGADGANAVWVVISKPAAGTWTVAPNSGSAPITSVMLSNGYVPATVKASVKRGQINYKISHLGSGQTVSFRESGRFGTHVLGTVDQAQGTLHFKPAGGAGGKRRVVALVERDGLITDQVAIGTYQAPPPPRPAKVGGLHAKQHGSALTVTFHPPHGAVRTEVTVDGAQGTHLAALAEGNTHKLTFGNVKWETKFKITARGVGDDGRAGPVSKLKLKAR